MDEPVYKDKRFEVLKARYIEHAAHIRDLNSFEFRYFGGFITLQLAVGSWFASQKLASWVPIVLLGAIDFAALVVCSLILYGARRRRKEITDTILNINEALGLYAIGVYLPDKAIDKKRVKGWFEFIFDTINWFILGSWVGFFGVLLILIRAYFWPGS